MSIDRKSCRALAMIAALVALTGCPDTQSSTEEGERASPAPATQSANDCETVGAHLASLTKHKFQGLEGRKQKIMKTQLQLVREEFATTCKKENWTATIRSCMTAAADLNAFNACTAPLRKARGMPPPASSQPKSGARPAPVAPKPIGTKRPTPQPKNNTPAAAEPAPATEQKTP